MHCQQLQQSTCTSCRLFVFGHDLVDALKYNFKTVLTFKEKTSTCNNYHILNEMFQHVQVNQYLVHYHVIYSIRMCQMCGWYIHSTTGYKYEYIRIGQLPVQIQIKTLLKEQQLNGII